LAGLNVMFDASVKANDKHYDVELASEPLEQALDEIALLTKCFWKPISEKTFFVAVDNPQNRRDYEEEVGEAVYLKNITAPQELLEISNVVRTLLDLRRLMTYTAQNAILVRGTSDQVRAAKKLINDMDKTKPEIVVDVLVMETSRSRSRQISAALSGSAAL